MIDNIIVSVIMPAYNAEKHIKHSIDSVINQTYRNWELIIIDDGSTDKTSDIINERLQNDERIIYLQQTNQKQSAARNAGIKVSKGIYIAFLDADDLWMPEKLEISLRILRNSTSDLLFTNCYIFENEIPNDLAALKKWGVKNECFKGKSAIITFLNYNPIPNLTVVVKKEILIKTGGFISITKAEDYEMWLRLLANGAVFESIELPLSLYRLHKESITATDRHATFELIEIIKTFGLKHPELLVETKSIANLKMKHWLYHGIYHNNRNFRKAIKGLYYFPKYLLFYFLSLLFPFYTLRKFIIRLT